MPASATMIFISQSSDCDDGADHRARATRGWRRDMSFQMHITLEHVLGSVSGHHDGELVITTVVAASHSAARGGGGNAIFACSSRQNPASMHANHAHGQRWRRGYCGASERAAACSHGISPSDAPDGADPGAASHAPSEPPRRRIIRTRRYGRGPEGRRQHRRRDGVDIRASEWKGLGRGTAAAAAAGVVAGRGRRRQTSSPSRVMLGRIRAGER